MKSLSANRRNKISKDPTHLIKKTINRGAFLNKCPLIRRGFFL